MLTTSTLAKARLDIMDRLPLEVVGRVQAFLGFRALCASASCSARLQRSAYRASEGIVFVLTVVMTKWFGEERRCESRAYDFDSHVETYGSLRSAVDAFRALKRSLAGIFPMHFPGPNESWNPSTYAATVTWMVCSKDRKHEENDDAGTRLTVTLVRQRVDNPPRSLVAAVKDMPFYQEAIDDCIEFEKVFPRCDISDLEEWQRDCYNEYMAIDA